MAGRRTWTYTQSTENALFKVAYGKHNAMAFNQRSVLYGRIKKKTNFKGKQMESSIRLSYGGGRGSGRLPRASRALYKTITLTTKKLYHRLSIDNETFEASKSSVGAFVNMSKEPMEVARIAFSNLLERQIVLGDLTGTGKLFVTAADATHDAVNASSEETADASAATVTLVLTSATIDAVVEEGDVLDLYSQGTNTRLGTGEVRSYDEDTRALVLRALTDVAAVTAGVDFYLQNSKDAELSGLQGVLTATTGTYKGIAIGRRWEAYQQAADGTSAVADRIKKQLNKAILQIIKRCGEAPTLLMCDHEVYTQILDEFEGIKRVQIPARGKGLKGQVGYAALEYVSPQGTIPVVFNRYVPAGQLYLLNENKIELCMRAAPQWLDRDGTVFLREQDLDSYEARYGLYTDLFIQPFYQGIITGLNLA